MKARVSKHRCAVDAEGKTVQLSEALCVSRCTKWKLSCDLAICQVSRDKKIRGGKSEREEEGERESEEGQRKQEKGDQCERGRGCVRVKTHGKNAKQKARTVKTREG